MCQTGYLTLKSPIDRYTDVVIGAANREVKTALFSLLGIRVFKNNVSPYNSERQYVLEKGSVKDIISLFNTVLDTIPYDKYPVNNESTLRALIQLYLIGKGHDVRSEQHNFKGSSDLLVNFKKRRVIIELKFSKDGKDAEALLKKAEDQIRKREYGAENLGDRELLQIAAVFDGSSKERKITSFEQIN